MVNKMLMLNALNKIPKLGLPSIILVALLFAGCDGGGGSTAASGNNNNSTDTTAPQVLGVTPVDTAIGIARTTTVVLSLNEDMKSSTVSTQSFTLAGSNSVSGTVSYDNNTRQATFTPASSLTGTTVYTASATGMTDLAGNALSTKTWSFTTQSSAAPIISVNQNLQVVSFGDALVIDASGTTDDQDALGALTFTWTVPPSTTISGLGKSNPTGIVAPSVPGPFTIGLTVIDTNGNQSTATVKYLVLEDAAHAVFVSATSGADTYTGTRLQPVKTLSKALTIAQSTSPVSDIYLEQGSYAVSSTTSVPDGVSLYGEFNNQFTTRAASADKTLISTHITGSTGASPVLQILSSTHSTTIDGIHVVAPNLATPASIALLVDGTGSNLSITNNYIESQGGANGAIGNNGTDGAIGTTGANGAAGNIDTSSSALALGGAGGVNSGCGVYGGKGGDGANATNGGTGVSGSGGASGGVGGTSGSTGTTGQPGAPGATGASGSNGSGGTGGAGTITSGRWTPTNGTNGLAGQPGQGGGGGGAGGGQTHFIASLQGTGNGGGGGGSGGCGGSLGTAGSGGSASIAIFLNSSSPSIQNNYIKTAAGGTGGTGGGGGAAGTGGPIGLGNTTNNGVEIGVGGNGGKGGDGGKGGAGGGGGGASIGIYRSASSGTVQSGNTFSTGLGGTGGASTGNSGSNGLSQNVY